MSVLTQSGRSLCLRFSRRLGSLRRRSNRSNPPGHRSVVVGVDALLGSGSMDLKQSKTSLSTSSTSMIHMTIFESVDELIADCKRSNSLLWMMIKDLEKDYRHSRNADEAIKKLEEISETLDALAGDLSE